MKRPPSVLLTLILAVACGAAPHGPTTDSTLRTAVVSTNPCDLSPCQWNDLGPQPVGSTLFSPWLVVAQNLPTVAWNQTGGGTFSQNAFVRVKTGTAWEAAQQLNDADSGSSPELTTDPSGTGPALVAFTEQRSTGSVIRVKYRAVVNGASVWKPFDAQTNSGLGTPGRTASNPTVVTTATFTAVAWGLDIPNSPNQEVFVWIYQGGVWRNLGTRADGSLADGGQPQLAVNANGGMALVYARNSGGSVYHAMAVQKWNGSNFVPVPDPSAGHALVCGNRDSLGVTSTGALVVALCNDTIGTLIVQQLTDSGQWTTLGAPLNVVSSNFAANPALKVSGTTVTVAWVEDDSGGTGTVYAKRWTSASQVWTPFGGAVNAGGTTGAPGLALYANGNPLTAFPQKNSGSGVWNLAVRDWSRPAPVGSP